MMIYYNLFAMICLYILWIMKKLIFSISMKLTCDQPSPVYSQNSDSTLWICLFVSCLLIIDYSSMYFCCLCWSLQSCPRHLEVYRSNIWLDKIFLSLQLHSQEKVWSTLLFDSSLHSCWQCFMKYWNVVLLTLPEICRSSLYIKLATVPQ